MGKMFRQEGNCLIRELHGEKLCIEPWGKNSLRVRAIMGSEFINEDWALDTEPDSCDGVTISINEQEAIIKNGKIRASIRYDGLITYYNQEDKILLKE